MPRANQWKWSALVTGQQEGALIGNLEMTRPFGGKCGVRSLLSVCQSMSTLNGQRNLTN